MLINELWQTNPLITFYEWFDPTHNQAGMGDVRISPYGGELRATPPIASTAAPAITGYDQYPTFPYRGNFNYMGWQFYVSPVTEAIFAYTHGYQGLQPITTQPIVSNPYPWEENLQKKGRVY